MVPPGRGEQKIRGGLRRIHRNEVRGRLRQRAGRPDMDIPGVHRDGRHEARGRGHRPREHLHRLDTRDNGERTQAGAGGAEH